jgi:hypothetical protein
LPTHLAYTSCLQLPSFFVMNTHPAGPAGRF